MKIEKINENLFLKINQKNIIIYELIENNETLYLSGKEKEKDGNKSFDYGVNSNNKKNRYRNLFNLNNEKNKSYITQMKKKKKNIMKLNPYKKEGDIKIKNKYIIKERDKSIKVEKENNDDEIDLHKSPTTFRKKIINEKPIFKKKINIQNKKLEKETDYNKNINKIEANKENNNYEDLFKKRKEEKNVHEDINIKPIYNNKNNNKTKKNFNKIIKKENKDNKKEIKLQDIFKINNIENKKEINNFNRNFENKNNDYMNKINKNIENNKINNNKNTNKKKKPKKKVFNLDESEEKEKEIITINNNKNSENKKEEVNNNIDNLYCSFAPKEKEMKEDKLLKELKEKLNERNKKKEENNEYKSNDLERIIKEHKNEQIVIKKPEANIDTIFNYIENEYNLSDEEKNNNNINNDRSFSFRQKFTGTFGQEGKNNNIIKENENERDTKFSFKINNDDNDNINNDKEKDIKLSFQINSDINESEFNDINYL